MHLRFLKTILRVKTSTPNDLVYAAIERVHLRFLKTILRVKTSTPNDLVYAELGRQTLHTKRLVQKVLGNYNVFISLFKQRLTDNYVQNTNGRLITHSRARFFNLFGTFQFHDYLNLVRIPKYKYSLIKLRLSSHRLAVETGRWNKPHPIPLKERKCHSCTSLEDEFHFLFERKLHDGLRKTYIPKYY